MTGRWVASGVAVLLCCVASPAPAQDTCEGVSASNNTTIKSVVVVDSPFLNLPIAVTHAPGDPDRLYIADQTGQIFVKQRGSAVDQIDVFMDITDRVYTHFTASEAGLVGLAFDPDFQSNLTFYVHYNTGSGFFCTDCATRVSRFTAIDPDTGNAGSETILLNLPQPQANHNGGQLMFDGAGFLHVLLGDGGGANDAHGTCGFAQDLGQPYGKVLRLDVAGRDPMATDPDTSCYTTAQGYLVPSGNPFVDGTGGDCDEVFAYGLRNPFRASFDRDTGDLYVADVGQQCWEELNYEAAPSGGTNYGWNVMEGLHCFNPPPNRPERSSDPPCADVADIACGSDPACFDAGLTLPVLEFQNPGGAAVIGGYVYRGCRMPNFDGTYFYGDNGAGFVRSFEISNGQAVNEQDWTAALGGAFASLSTFGEDARGEIYFVPNIGGFTVNKLMPPFPDLEVSGGGAVSFRPSRDTDWTWEDLFFSSMHPVDFYRVYRGVPGGSFECIHSTVDTTWINGGDLTTPAVGELFAYLVTAVSVGEETSSGSPPRTLINPCPAP